MRHAITVRAVMAFSLLLAANAVAAENQQFPLYWGNATACDAEEFGVKLAPSDSRDRLLAAFAESGNYSTWVRILRRGEKVAVETTTFDAWHRSPNVRRRSIDAALAAQVSARLADDLAHDALVQGSDEIQIDGIWYLYTPDGKTCATLPWDRNTQARNWAQLFYALSETAAVRDAQAWFWLDQLDQQPATLPTLLASMSDEQAVIGAGTSWKHAGTEPMTIVSHRASTGYLDGSVIIDGELANNLGTARKRPDVVATFYDANGAVLATEDGVVHFNRLPAGARSPFFVHSKVKNAASYTLRIVPGEAVWLRPQSLRITRHGARQVDEDLVVRGSVRNDGKRVEDDLEIYLLVYDEAGRLLDSESEDIDEPLRPGASAAFEVSVERPAGYHHYELVVDPEYREQRERQ